MKIQTIYHLFKDFKEIFKDRPFVRYRNKAGEWVKLSIEEYYEQVYILAAGLHSLNLKKNDKICLMGDTYYKWNIIDFSIEITGLVNVPIYPTLTPGQIEFIINDSEAKIIFVSNEEYLKKIIQIKNQLNNVEKIIVIDNFDFKEDEKLISINKIKEIGADILKSKSSDYLEQMGESINEDDLATILYTSGTTGIPKGVMLSHKNIVSNALGAVNKLKLTKYKSTLIFLPLSHAFSRTCTYALLYAGLTVWYAENLNTLGRDMIESKPEVMIVVPRVFEKVYERILDSINENGGIKKIIFYWAKKIAIRVARRKLRNAKVSPFLKFQYHIADRLVYKTIREKTGGRLNFAVSGSSPLPNYISYFFFGIGIPVLEGYGLTEASPIISTNTLEKNVIGTVGTPFEKIEIKLDDENELMIKGPNVMMGYYKNKEETEKVITEDGWLRTGDICEIVHDDFIKIIDRKKDLFKTSGGKYIAPQKIENLAKKNQYIEEFVVIAENRKFASAIILPNFDKLEKYASENNLTYKDLDELVNDKRIHQLYQKIIDEDINSELARYETIKKFIIINEAFTIENGQLTPTLKIKRKKVNEVYRSSLNKLYSE